MGAGWAWVGTLVLSHACCDLGPVALLLRASVSPLAKKRIAGCLNKNRRSLSDPQWRPESAPSVVTQETSLGVLPPAGRVLVLRTPQK